jgi:hypothetical protein
MRRGRIPRLAGNVALAQAKFAFDALAGSVALRKDSAGFGARLR